MIKVNKQCSGCFPVFQPNQLAHDCLMNQYESDNESYSSDTPIEICPICLSEFDDYYSDDIFITKCSHKFHSCCIATSLSYNKNCPICRTVFDDTNKILSDIFNITINTEITNNNENDEDDNTVSSIYSFRNEEESITDNSSSDSDLSLII
jgi:hypothetical protein